MFNFTKRYDNIKERQRIRKIKRTINKNMGLIGESKIRKNRSPTMMSDIDYLLYVIDKLVDDIDYLSSEVRRLENDD